MEELGILIVDDEELLRREVVEMLEFGQYKLYDAGTPSEAFKILENSQIDIMLLDIKLPEMDGLKVLQIVKEKYPEIEVIMITGHGDSDILLKALRLGAYDFFHKPLEVEEIESSIQRTKKYLTLQNKVKSLQAGNYLISKQLTKSIGDLVGKSSAMKHVIDLTLQAAASRDTSILITGPSGSGKELIAKVIHYASQRNENVFFTANCSAIPESLIESELFGHRKGAFTGANEDRPGYFEATNFGTLFLDEIGDMPLTAQAKILRVLEDKKVKRIGDRKEINLDVRVVAATNKDMLKEIEAKRFREDLYYRLNTIEIRVPPLTERIEDIPLLLEYFVRHFCEKIGCETKKISSVVYDSLAKYAFPGNIRELRNMVERAVIISNGKQLEIEHFPVTSAVGSEQSVAMTPSQVLPTFNLDAVVQQTIRAALEKTSYNQRKASELLGLSKSALNRKIQKYEIEIK